MWPLLASVLTASLLGSTHCAGMCGAFVAFAVGLDDADATRRRARLHAAYNGGRLVTYAALGAAAGAAGGALNLAGSAVGLSRVAAAIAGATLIVFGAGQLLRALGVRVRPVAPPRVLRSLVGRAHRAALALPPLRRAFLIGLATTLLPCGWLYAFVAVAAGTARPDLGALTMAAFWLGTLPVLVAIGAGVRALSGPLAARMPYVLPMLVIAAGLFTVVSRLGIDADALAGVSAHVHTASLETLSESVGDLDAESMPCCSEPAADDDR